MQTLLSILYIRYYLSIGVLSVKTLEKYILKITNHRLMLVVLAL